MDREIIAGAERMLSQFYGNAIRITGYRAVGGGSINDAFCLDTNEGSFFLKANDRNKFPAMFDAERKGLELLRSADAIRVPGVIGVGEAGRTSFLLMEYLERAKTIPDFREQFAQQLATLHRTTRTDFGLDHNNYMGSLRQSNRAHADYVSFFIEERLKPQLKLAGASLAYLRPAFEKLYTKLPEIIPAEKPALVHGDLWSGNFLVGPEGKACLIDPAVHYGHREADIAMTRLFGGFDKEFYTEYNNAFPMEKGWESRMDIYNLYPLLVHVNLFGGGYVQSVASIVSGY